jgi:K+-sensing histidine kinase KdpD
MDQGEKAQHLLDISNSSSQILLNKINDLQDYGEIESGQFSVNFEEFSLRDLGKEVITLSQFQFQRKGLKLHLVISDNVPQKVCSDQKRIKQILLNLLSNGIQYTEKGKIQLKITKKDNEFKFSVSDTGIGIQKQKLKRLSTICGNSSTELKSEYSTKLAGLGISISSLLCKRLSSDLKIKSTVGKGTKCWFTIRMIIEKRRFSEKKLRKLKIEAQLRLKEIRSTSSRFAESAKKMEREQNQHRNYSNDYIETEIPEEMTASSLQSEILTNMLFIQFLINKFNFKEKNKESPSRRN